MTTIASVEAVYGAMLHRRSMGLSRLKPDPVDHGLIKQVLEAANWAPSQGDTEPWRFTVFAGEGRAALAELFERAHQEDAANYPSGGGREGAGKRAFSAPVWISIGMVPGRRPDGSLQMSFDDELMAVACAVQNLHLMASTLGLAGGWHSKGTSVHPAVARGLGLIAPNRLLGFVMLGWPSGEWLTSSRRPLSEKVRWVEK